MKLTANAEELLLLLKGIKGFWLEPKIQSGVDNMETDKHLMQQVQAYMESIFLLRAYAWQEPTLSLGVNQPEKDLITLAPPVAMPIVRRPTGGRAIWHGDDYSYAFISNSPVLLRLSVKDSYCIISQVLKHALQGLSIDTASSEACEQSAPDISDKKSYTRSPECFATQMPDDLIRNSGTKKTQKIAGSAQCRKAGVLLQHGSVYLKDEGVSFERFSQALKDSMQISVGDSLNTWTI
jgi:lipoate-protein ligase A